MRKKTLKVGAKSLRINEHRRALKVMMNFNKDCRKLMTILQNYSPSTEKHPKCMKIDNKSMRINENRGKSKKSDEN